MVNPELPVFINGFERHLWLAVVCILFSPCYWNVVCLCSAV